MNRLALLTAISLIPTIAYADLPLTVESLITNKGNLSFENTVLYGNIKTNQAQLSEIFPVQINANSYINIPSEIITSQQQ